jgi:hypothetical protein
MLEGLLGQRRPEPQGAGPLGALYLARVVRRMTGQVVALPSGLGGIVRRAGWFGCDLELPDGDTLHLPYATVPNLMSGPGITDGFKTVRGRAQAHAKEGCSNCRPEPQPALSPEEIERELAIMNGREGGDASA